MIRLDGEDGAVEKYTYMDQFPLVRLVELEAVMNEYLCSPISKTAHVELAFQKKNLFW